MDLENSLWELRADYSELLSSIKILRDAVSNESNMPELGDISNSLNLIANKMTSVNLRLDVVSEEIFND